LFDAPVLRGSDAEDESVPVEPALAPVGMVPALLLLEGTVLAEPDDDDGTCPVLDAELEGTDAEPEGTDAEPEGTDTELEGTDDAEPEPVGDAPLESVREKLATGEPASAHA